MWPDDGYQNEENDEGAAAYRDLVAAEPHPRDLSKRAALDGGTADSLEDRLRLGVGRHFEWRGHKQATLQDDGDGNPPAVAWPGRVARPLPENVSGTARSARGQPVSFLDCDLI